MYRNIIYSTTAGTITEFSWDHAGNPAEYVSKFKPYVYVETASDKPDAISIFNTKLKKIEFRNEKDKRTFVDKNSHRRIFYNLPVKQQYLIEKYKDKTLEEMMKFPLRIFYLDIEVYSPDTFPEADEAKFPVNVLTIGDSLDGKIYTWGLKEDYDPSHVKSVGLNPKDIVYTKCSSEVDLLECFLKFWSRNYPDVVTGWNSSTFDIPYIINRMTALLGEDEVKKLSPNSFIYNKIRTNIFDRYYTHWIIDGIADIDYLELYAKFEPRQHESYKLDYIGNIEKVDGKVAYNAANLAELADTDWDKFITYNIQDVNIIIKLESKKNYLKIARAKAYRGLSPLDKAMDSVPIVTGLIAKTALDDNKIIVTNQASSASEEFDGGFVYKPTGKVHKGVVSFDVNSLYPNTMITLNTSPETKIGKVARSGDTIILTTVNGKRREITEDQLNEFIKKNDLVLTKADVIFSQKKMGICPKFLDQLYKDRVRIKKEMETEEDPSKKAALDLEQYLLKILLNSVYGVFGNKYFALYDVDIAKSVTLTGQSMIKEAMEIVKDYSDEKINDESFDSESIVVYGDTDSCFFDFDSILDKMGVKFFNSNEDGSVEVTEEAHDIIKDFEVTLNNRINEWAREVLNSKDPRYKFSREKICYMGLFITKKNYIIRVVDNEGESCDKIVARGVELVKSSHSQEVKDLIQGIIKGIFYNKTKKEIDELYMASLEEFKELPPSAIALRKNAKDHEKWATKDINRIAKGTPSHHKAAIYYNYLISDLGLEGKYPKISSGQKIKTIYLAPNKYGFKYMAFLDDLPEEFGLEPDYKTQFNKMVSSLVTRCYNGLGWMVPDVDNIRYVDLFEFLGIE